MQQKSLFPANICATDKEIIVTMLLLVTIKAVNLPSVASITSPSVFSSVAKSSRQGILVLTVPL